MICCELPSCSNHRAGCCAALLLRSHDLEPPSCVCLCAALSLPSRCPVMTSSCHHVPPGLSSSCELPRSLSLSLTLCHFMQDGYYSRGCSHEVPGGRSTRRGAEATTGVKRHFLCEDGRQHEAGQRPKKAQAETPRHPCFVLPCFVLYCGLIIDW